jgi:hypothetical protein
LFGLATLAVAIGVTYVLPHVTGPISPKLAGAVYFAIYGAGATLAVLLTSAGALRAFAAHGVASIGLGTFYYIVVARATSAAVEQLGASASGASAVGSSVGLVFAVGFAVAALAGSSAGALFAAKLRRGFVRPVFSRSA